MQDIPKIFTAITEWSACLVFILILKRRFSFKKTIGLSGLFLIFLVLLQMGIGVWPVLFWIPAMLVAMFLMYLYIVICCDTDALDAALCWAMAFLTAEFVASFEWQIYKFVEYRMKWRNDTSVIEFLLGTVRADLFAFLFFLIFFLLFYFVEKKIIPTDLRFDIMWREVAGCMLMTFAVFFLSNISYVFPNTPFSSRELSELFYIRTLVDFSGVLIVVTQQNRFVENRLKTELATTNMLMGRQYEQYQLSKNNIEVLNRKYHDLKHQIAVIRSESNEERREAYLSDLEKEIQTYEAQNKTGNGVLDTILTSKSLYCVQEGIQFTCVVDGKLLNFMNVMDLCALFGNALDNAIECAKKIKDRSKRIIRTAVYSQNQFVIIRFENYFEEKFETEEKDGMFLPVTTKKEKEYHGYGIKSIRSTVEKYGGTMTIETEKNWFYLRILIPVNEKKRGNQSS